MEYNNARGLNSKNAETSNVASNGRFSQCNVAVKVCTFDKLFLHQKCKLVFWYPIFTIFSSLGDNKCYFATNVMLSAVKVLRDYIKGLVNQQPMYGYLEAFCANLCLYCSHTDQGCANQGEGRMNESE